MDKAAYYFFGTCFPVFTIVGAYLLYVSWRRGNASVHWPSVTGSVIESRFVREGDTNFLIGALVLFALFGAGIGMLVYAVLA